ncbi:MAG TPA: hypothetical protein VHT96_06795 [Clostridia bacterium]|nr:hypothetical protein [Clostridia bacterium]
MPNALSKVFALLIAVVILFVFPIKNELERQDETSRMYVLNETIGLVDSVRNLGYLSPRMYEEFLDELAATGNIYKVEMEHASLIYQPVYEYNAVSGTYDAVEGEYEQTYNSTYADVIGECLFPEADPAAGKNYEMKQGDFFTVRVVNQNKTMATKIQEIMYGRSIMAEKIFVNYGGMIKDEGN